MTPPPPTFPDVASQTYDPDGRDLDVPVCEACGYKLLGLGVDDACPECGTPVRHSTVDSGRGLALWETSPSARSWLRTSLAILGRPGGFFRTLRARVDPAETPGRAASFWFAAYHFAVASVLATYAILGHFALASDVVDPYLLFACGGIPALMLLGPLVLAGCLAARLTVVALSAWETRWRGMRLDRRVIERGIDYHAAHVSFVCLGVLLVVAAAQLGFRLGLLGLDDVYGYLIALSASVIVGAVWLFWTYWLAMSNLMRANT